MVDFAPLWTTLEEKGLSATKLSTEYGISTSQVNRLKHNKNVSVVTIERLCKILECDMTKIVTIDYK